MLIAAAVCPHPPLLIPQATGAPGPLVPPDAELGRLRTACHQAVAALVGERPDLLVVVGGAPGAGRAAEYPPDATGSLHEFGVPFTVGGDQDPPDAGGPPVLPLSLTIAKWLLSRAPREVPQVACWEVASDAATTECVELGEKLAALAPRVGMLAMGDGPGRRARGALGAADPQADRYEARVAASLAAGDPGALAALDPRQDGPLVIAGRAAWQVLAGAAGRDRFDADLRYFAAPFEVTYFVASWRRRAAVL